MLGKFILRNAAGSASIAALLLLTARAARAQEHEAPERGRVYSHYETETLAASLERLHGHLDSAPEGKIIESVEVDPLEVVEPRDPIPNILALPRILNFIHSTSRPYTIRREVLQRPGDRYRQALIDETCRNLRGLIQLSLVLCVPMEGSAPDRVRVAVITKDVWSLRLGWNLSYANGKLENLLVAPTESNLGGTHQSITATFSLDPATYSIGATYVVPRLADSRIAASVDANIELNRDTGTAEGSFGSLTYGQPLYSTQAEWAWQASIIWRKDIHRRFISGEVAGFDSKSTPQIDGIPYLYHQDLLDGEYDVTRSFGRSNKNDFTLAVYANRSVYRTDDLSAFDPRARDSFLKTVVPTSDTRMGPYVSWHAYSTRFQRVLDFNTLGLQEDYRLGYNVWLRVAPVSKVFDSTRDFVSIFAAAAYTVGLGDGLARFFAETTTELDSSRIWDGEVDAGGRIMSPTLPFGRIVFDTIVIDRFRNYLNRRTTLGGDTRLRGYPTGALIGANVVAANLELRTKPVEILTAQIGAAAFFDSGDAFDDWSQICLKQGAGAGLRGLLPMLDRVVLRLDWGFPLSSGAHKCYQPPTTSAFPGELFLTFSQAFPMPAIPNAGAPHPE